MANHLKIIGEAYKQFKDTNTSLSAAKSPHHIRAFQRYFLTKEENNKCTNASLTLGTITHDVTEKAWVENKTIEEVFNSKIIQDKINNYVPFDEKDKMKFQFGLKYLKDIAKNHIENLKELPKQKWKTEVELTTWTPPVSIYWRMFLDLMGETHINDLKNKFPTPKLAPLKVKQKKENPNRIGDWVCTLSKIDPKVFTSDLMQIALYAHATGLKPSLSYASATDRVLFTEDNTPELKQENLKIWLKELMAYELAWEKKLKAANGSLDELMWLCVPDFSDVRKKSFWWVGVPEEYIERYMNFYV